MKIHKYTELEVKLTAILYATREEVVRYVIKTGKLPENIPPAGFPTAMNVLVRNRGLEPELTGDERLVLKAIETDKLLPGGGIILAEDRFPIYSIEPGQHIQIYPLPRDMEWED